MPKYAARVKGELHKILNALREKMQWLAENIPGKVGRQAKETEDTIEHVTKMADQKIDEAAKGLQDGLNKTLEEKIDSTHEGTRPIKETPAAWLTSRCPRQWLGRSA